MADKEKKYRVTAPTGQFTEGDTVTEEQAGPWFAKWLKSGALELAKESQAEAEAGTQDEQGSVSRSAELATGDADAVSRPATQPKK